MDRACEVEIQLDLSGYVALVHGGEDANWNVWGSDYVREAYALDHGGTSTISRCQPRHATKLFSWFVVILPPLTGRHVAVVAGVRGRGG